MHKSQMTYHIMEVLEFVDTEQDNGTNNKDKFENNNPPSDTMELGNTTTDKEDEPGDLHTHIISISTKSVYNIMTGIYLTAARTEVAKIVGLDKL